MRHCAATSAAGSKTAARRHLCGAAFEVDARVDHHVCQVADQLQHQADQREHVERAEHDRVVAVDRGLESEQAQPVEREDDLDQQRAGEQDADERRRKSGDDQQHRVAEHMAVQHAALGQPLGARGQHVLLVDLVDEEFLVSIVRVAKPPITSAVIGSAMCQK